MPLNDGYGVLLGSIVDYYRDPPDDFGRYYHGNLRIAAAGREYRCAIDVDSHQSNTGVEWRVVGLNSSDLDAVRSLAPGYHALASTPASGAVDYVRSQMFAARVGCLMALMRALGRQNYGVQDTWKRGTSAEALADLEPLVTATRAANLTALIFGEPFSTGYGMHNIHQNQGDPLGSPWAAENAIWQDGCTILQQSADSYVAFMNKFTSQAYETDDFGHPA